MHKIFKFKHFLTAWSKKRLIWLAVGVLVIGGGTYAFIGGGDTITTVKAEIGEVREEVVVTGKTVSASSVNLGFERSGKIVTDAIEVGSQVSAGQTLVVLDQSELTATLNKAKANLNKALVELQATRRESASSYDEAVSTLVESIKEAYIQADDAVRNESDQLFNNPRDFSATFDPSFSDGGFTYLSPISASTKNHLSDMRVDIEELFENWESEVAEVSTTPEALETAYQMSRANLRTVQNFLDEIAAAVNSITTDEYDYKATIDGYKTTVSSARNIILSALSTLSNTKTDYNNAPFIEAGGTYDDVLAEEARIESLRQDVRAIEADLAKTVLVSPIAGVVTSDEAKKGEMITAGSILVSVLSESELRIEAEVSEISIGRIEEGNSVAITFDAFPEQVFDGTVLYIDPAEVLVDEVPTYKVTIVFANGLPERIRSGLTANLRILTNKRDGVVKIPVYALERDEEEYFVEIKTQEGSERREVSIGLRGEDGSIEILSGLAAGEEIVIK